MIHEFVSKAVDVVDVVSVSKNRHSEDGSPMRRFADATVRRCDGSPMRRFADATVRRCDGSPMRRFADATVRRCDGSPMRFLKPARSCLMRVTNPPEVRFFNLTSLTPRTAKPF
jgi:hypothetical protein